MRLGTWEIVAVVTVVLLIFGPSKLPALGKSLGEFFKNMKRGAKELKQDAAAITEELKN